MDFLKITSKGLILVLQIVIVAALAAAFVWFDPLGVFTSSKKTLKDTPIQVRSIKEIGQIITAEYYGEVIASLEEVFDQETKMQIDSFNYDIELLHRDFVTAIDSIASQDLKRNKIFESFTTEYQDIREDKLFNQYAYYINEKLKDRNYSKRELYKVLNTADLTDFITKLGLKRRQDLRDDLHSITTDEIQDRFKDLKTNEQDKNNKRQRLVLLGRGWVKAGFDFGTFNETNFTYDKVNNRIFIRGIKPKILSATINPWFIPEKGVEGFEFVVVERRVKQKPDLTKRVKQRCLDKLINQAMEKQILEKAQSNAEKHLSGFFSLMTENKKPIQVIFNTNPLNFSLEELLKDSLIRDEEILTLNDILIQYGKLKDLEIDDDLLKRLNRAKKEIYGQNYTMNSKSPWLFQLVKDRKIDNDDQKYLDALDKQTTADTLWGNLIFNGKVQDIKELKHQVLIDLAQLIKTLEIPVDQDMQKLIISSE